MPTPEEILTEQAALLGTATVTVDRPMQWVSISDTAMPCIFLQGDDAQTFIANVDELLEKYPDLMPDVATAAVAAPLTESLWN